MIANIPTKQPTLHPTLSPSSYVPTKKPVKTPNVSSKPAYLPTAKPKSLPTYKSTKVPAKPPSIKPQGLPSQNPTGVPNRIPSKKPNFSPSKKPNKTSKPQTIKPVTIISNKGGDVSSTTQNTMDDSFIYVAVIGFTLIVAVGIFICYRKYRNTSNSIQTKVFPALSDFYSNGLDNLNELNNENQLRTHISASFISQR